MQIKLAPFLVKFIAFFSTADRVFSAECSTRKVYEEGAKGIALAVVSGINCKHGFSFPIVFPFYFPFASHYLS